MEWEKASVSSPRGNSLIGETACEPRERSATEMSIQALDNANRDLDAVVNQLTDRLQPILHGQKPTATDGSKARPSMDAQLPESIMAQAECVEVRIGHLRQLISRLAI